MTEYIAANREAWSIWIMRNAHTARSAPERFTEMVLYAARNMGAGFEDADMREIGTTYSMLLCAPCVLYYVPVPVNAKQFYAAIKEGFCHAHESAREKRKECDIR